MTFVVLVYLHIYIYVHIAQLHSLNTQHMAGMVQVLPLEGNSPFDLVVFLKESKAVLSKKMLASFIIAPRSHSNSDCVLI